MATRWDPSDDPTRRLFHKVVPWISGIVLAGMVLGRRDALISGQPLPTVAALVGLAYWTWLFFFASRHGRTMRLDDADSVRDAQRRSALEASLFVLAAGLVAVWASAERGFDARYLLGLVLPGAMTVASLVMWTQADRVAAKVRAQEPGGSPRGAARESG